MLDRDRRVILVLFLVAGVSGALRWGMDLGGAHRLVRAGASWPTPHRLPRPPFEGPTLLLFGADWCPDCQVFEETVVSGKAFADFVQENRLQPIRIRDETLGRFRFLKALEEYQVGGIPAAVVVSASGAASVPILGALPEESFEEEILWRLDWVERSIRWRNWLGEERRRRRRPALLLFDRARSVPGVEAWWQEWRPSVARDLNARFDLFTVDKAKPPRAAEAYRRWRIDQTPTLVVIDEYGREIRRFEGARAVAEASSLLAAESQAESRHQENREERTDAGR